MKKRGVCWDSLSDMYSISGGGFDPDALLYVVDHYVQALGVKRPIVLKVRNGVSDLADCTSSAKQHIIGVSWRACRLIAIEGEYVGLDAHQATPILIHALLHELQHAAHQERKNPRDPQLNLKHPHLRYQYSFLETAAEAFALTHIFNACTLYDYACNAAANQRVKK